MEILVGKLRRKADSDLQDERRVYEKERAARKDRFTDLLSRLSPEGAREDSPVLQPSSPSRAQTSTQREFADQHHTPKTRTPAKRSRVQAGASAPERCYRLGTQGIRLLTDSPEADSPVHARLLVWDDQGEDRAAFALPSVPDCLVEKHPACYKISPTGELRWAPGYEDGGKYADLQEIPVAISDTEW